MDLSKCEGKVEVVPHTQKGEKKNFGDVKHIEGVFLCYSEKRM
jgi:hypothetical protein